MRLTKPLATWLKSLNSLLLLGILSGCATMPLEKARVEFYSGHFQEAEATLTPVPEEDKDRVLFLMERGMARQAGGLYDASSADWRAAAELNEKLETYSVSRGAASLLTSDRTLSFRGKPFERTLLFTFLAINYLAEHNWDYAAICARNIIQHLENLDGFPDIAYSRYMAGFCLEMIYDTGNAALQYRTASELLEYIFINENNGHISSSPPEDDEKPVPPAPYELVCFVAIGRAYDENVYLQTPHLSLDETPETSPYAEFYFDGEYIGRSHTFNNTGILMNKTQQQLALLQLAKDISRIAIKETISQAVENQNELLGFLTRLTLFALEIPDTRRWETLPRWMGVARIPLSEPPTNYTVIFKNSFGHPIHRRIITEPISRRGNIFFSFCRDAPSDPTQ